MCFSFSSKFELTSKYLQILILVILNQHMKTKQPFSIVVLDMQTPVGYFEV